MVYEAHRALSAEDGVKVAHRSWIDHPGLAADLTIGVWRNGSASDFDSEGYSSILYTPANFASKP